MNNPTIGPFKQPPDLPVESSHDEISDYAYHLYIQNGATDGHDRDDWLEAEACLRARIPKESSRTRLQRHSEITIREALPLVPHGNPNRRAGAAA